MERCRKKYFQEYNQQNVEKVKERRKLYRLKNKERDNQLSKEYRKNHKHKGTEYEQKRVGNLEKSYVISQLKQQGFKQEQIEVLPQLIELKRLTLKTKRLCKQLKN
jgi:hypothetical protein